MNKLIAVTIEPLVHAYMKRTTTPGVAVALHFQGKDYLLPYGHADLEKKTCVTCDTIFEIGSMTKVFTATLLASQVVEKVIPSLTDCLPFERLPPRVGESGDTIKEVSYLQLATHTSGLQDSADSLGGHPSQQLFDGEPPAQHLTDWWIQSSATPGVCWEYSNIGFVTLGFAVVGRSAGAGYQPYETLLQERITDLLGMGSTSVHAGGPNVAQGYRYKKTGPVASKNEASDLKSSARDILIFLRANLGLWPSVDPRFADLAAAIAMTQKIYVDTPVNCVSGKPTSFSMGLAWQVSQPHTASRRYAKDGATGLGGFTTYMEFAPAEGIAISVLTNLDGAGSLKPPESPAKLANEILAALLDGR